MVSAVAARPIAPRIDPSPAPRLAETSRYAADWRAPASPPIVPPTPARVAPAQPAGASPISAVDRAKQNALLSVDVYQDRPNPPAGFRVADQRDLDRLNLTPSQLEQPGSSFRARVYATGEGANTRYVVAFRGSSTGEDWKNNFQQGVGLNAESYNKALAIGQRLARSDANVTLTGHSLGGGLASAAAIASGRQADTFNAAGLHGDTITTATNIATAAGRGPAAVQAYHVPGEVLTSAQQGTDGWLWGKADLPNAFGTSHTLPDVVPAGKNWIERHNPVDRHMIDWVLAGAGALR